MQLKDKNRFEEIEKRGYQLIPICPFIIAHTKRHPELKFLLEENFKGDE